MFTNASMLYMCYICLAVSGSDHLCLKSLQGLQAVGLQSMSAAIFTLCYALREFGAYHYVSDPNEQTPLIVHVLSQVFILASPSV